MAGKCPDESLHGNPFRYCPSCDWIEPAPPKEREHILDHSEKCWCNPVVITVPAKEK